MDDGKSRPGDETEQCKVGGQKLTVTKADAQVEMWEEGIAEKLLDSSGGSDWRLMRLLKGTEGKVNDNGTVQ
jgi:hypothetical protein